MNYLHNAVDEFMKDNKIKFDKAFLVEGWGPFTLDNLYNLYDSQGFLCPEVLNSLLKGVYKVEKDTLELKLLDHPTFRGWLVNVKGDVVMVGGTDAWDREYKAGNVFETQAEAEKEKARRILNRKLREWKYENDKEPLTRGFSIMHGIVGCHQESEEPAKAIIDHSRLYTHNNGLGVYFSSGTLAEKARDTFKEELTEYFNMEG